ncbi:diguanylate cyclase [Solidesulfovibrio fructosivorans JJ]]|uniref:diguanylate cyclase n=1 Tax=Solidesulfovibrio fructosivorans JJ] TaxID=596151 RepID=E1JXB9_SOLFR|nr:GGDEF domain-containing protein [Solidesulfovibrio fructosivorans]EFL50896.1 diguanylate cyclase [Solidesulfovibrio fructosivorans JJ]]
MLQSLDIRTVLFEGALVCFAIFGIMAYHCLARKTYPGFRYWTFGFMCVGTGAILVALRGNLPDVLSIILANLLIAAMPFTLAWGLTVFLDVPWTRRTIHIVIFVALLLALTWSTYVSPSLYWRIICVSLVFLVFFAEALRIAVKHLPEALGAQNWLLVTMIAFSLVSMALRLGIAASMGSSLTFFRNGGAWQSAAILLTILSMVGIMASLIILNAQRLELELKEANRKIEILANQDGLTSLFNRRYFDKKLVQEFKRLQRSAQPLSLIMADIDCFKNFNDTYGHQAGDDCIRAIADAFKQSGGRVSDIAARYGGEEFVMLLPNTDTRGANTVAREISERVTAKAIAHATSVAAPIVTLSMGVATIMPARSMRPKTLVEMADQALYASKSNGRNQIRNYAPEQKTRLAPTCADTA